MKVYSTGEQKVSPVASVRKTPEISPSLSKHDSARSVSVSKRRWSTDSSENQPQHLSVSSTKPKQPKKSSYEAEGKEN